MVLVLEHRARTHHTVLRRHHPVSVDQPTCLWHRVFGFHARCQQLWRCGEHCQKPAAFDTCSIWACPADVSGTCLGEDGIQNLSGSRPRERNEKLPLMVTGDDAQVYIDLFLDGDEGEQADVAADGADRNGRRVRQRRTTGDQELRYLNSLIIGLRQDNAAMRLEMQRVSAIHLREMEILKQNQQQLMRSRYFTAQQRPQQQQPNLININNDNNMNGNVGLAAAAVVENQVPNNSDATLSPCPRTLHTLWQEYEFGLGNRKAAKDFTPEERGRVKNLYSKRKIVWSKIADMVRGGWDANQACNRIYEVYGANQTVTTIINLMRCDKANGGHPALRVENL